MVAGSTAWPMVRLAFTWLTCGECTEMFPGPRRTCAPPTIGPARPSVAPPRWGATKISVSSSPGMIITDSNQRSAVGRPRKHGGELALADPATWPAPQITTSTATSRYGTALAAAWDRVHPRLTHRSAWLDHDGPLPVIDGTLIRLQVEHLPGDRRPKPVWLWSSATGIAPDQVDRLWQAFLRRFDLEHTFRLFKQVLGWTAPKIRDPAAADRWTWLIIAVHAQLRLARPLADDLRHPWERPAPPSRLTPARVRRGLRNIRATIGCPASAPKPGKPGPGRPPGSRNRRPAPRYDVGKNSRRERSLKSKENEQVKRQV